MPKILLRKGPQIANRGASPFLTSNEPEPVTLRQFIWFTAPEETYVFPYAPREIAYEDLAAEIVEVERSQRYPLVEFKSPRLMKISFEVRIANRSSRGKLPIDEDLRKLRYMALRDTNVRITGLDRLVSERAFPWSGSIETAWFKWTSFSITAQQREVLPGIGHAITQANCAFQFVEWRNEVIQSVPLPRIFYPPEVPSNEGGGGEPTIVGTGTPDRARYTTAPRPNVNPTNPSAFFQ